MKLPWSPASDEEKLNKIMQEKKEDESALLQDIFRQCNDEAVSPTPASPAVQQSTDYCQWSTGPNDSYRPSGPRREKLPSGVYVVAVDQMGPFFIRTKVVTDNLIELDDAAGNRVLSSIRKFWKSRERYTKRGVLYKRGLLLWGPAGCHAAGTEVVMESGNLKKIEDVTVGDKLMSPDGTSRTVLELCRGYDDMYEIHPRKGEPFIVNGHHVLSLGRSDTKEKRYPSILNISVNEYLGLTKCSQKLCKLRRAAAISFSSDVHPQMNAYLLGVWLGDGTEDKTGITTADPEIKELCYAVASENGLHVNPSRKTDSICWTYDLCGGGGDGSNPFRNWLKHYNLLGNKHIPEAYFVADIPTRLNLLAGLIDTDGGNEGSWRASSKYKQTGTGKGFFSITQKRGNLALGIVRLARSLGFGATITPTIKTIKSRGFSGIYFRVSIYGDIERIPVRVPRKKSAKGHPNKNHLHTGIDKIVPLGVGPYYGFTLSGDHLYMTGDFTIHHNSGKTATLTLLMNDLLKMDGLVFICQDPSLLASMLSVLRRIEPDRNLIIVLEDIDEIIHHHGEHDLLALLDGETQIDNVVSVATTNYPERLGARIINRPSRFDERIFVDMPNEASREKYIRHITKHENIDEDTIGIWVKRTKGFSVAHLRELAVAVFCLDQDFEEVLERLSKMQYQPKPMKEFTRTEFGLATSASKTASGFQSGVATPSNPAGVGRIT